MSTRHAPHSRLVSLVRGPWTLLALAAALMALWAALPMAPKVDAPPPAPPAPPSPISIDWASLEADARGVSPAEWYMGDVAPLLDRASDADRAAVDRALASLHERFNACRAGAPAFAEAVTAWGTRAGLAKRMAADSWDRAWGRIDDRSPRVQWRIEQLFKEHVLAEGVIESALRDAGETLAHDIESRRNETWSQIAVSLRTDDAPVGAASLDFEAFERSVRQTAAALAAGRAERSVASGAATLAMSAAGGWLAEQAAAQAISRLGLSAAGAAARGAAGAAAGAAGGTAGGASAGGAAGALGGPGGAIIGFGVGLAVGVVIDWWMTEDFRDRLEGEVVAYIDALEREVIDGADGRPGLRAALLDAVEQAGRAQRDAVLAHLPADWAEPAPHTSARANTDEGATP